MVHEMNTTQGLRPFGGPFDDDELLVFKTSAEIDRVERIKKLAQVSMFTLACALFFLVGIAVAAIDMVPVEWLVAVLVLAVGAIVLLRAMVLRRAALIRRE